MPESALPRPAPLVPKILTTLAEGYRLADLRKDAIAGLTVAIVALPLSMAIAVACGVGPERGLYTAIVGGFLVSALGGSRFQVGGPAGAFIVLVAAAVARFGLEGLAIIVFMSGVMLAIAGLFRLGDLVRRIPHAVSIGFTAGIAVIIMASQLKDFFGLAPAAEPEHVLPKIFELAKSAGTASPAATIVATVVAGLIFLLRRYRPTWPGMLIAIVLAAVTAAVFALPVETIGSRFGAIPRALPSPHLPQVSLGDLWMMLPMALSFTLLGSIESLLSAVVADRMTERRHRPNMELIAQGFANMGSALFGGLAVTGTIARTATNVRAGARSPVSGMLHAIFLLLFMLLAAPLAAFIPIPALAGVLVVVAWNMIEKHEVGRMAASPKTLLILGATFAMTVIFDLTAGIAAGCGLAIAFWIRDTVKRLA
jgi:SulP family sulfate permease